MSVLFITENGKMSKADIKLFRLLKIGSIVVPAGYPGAFGNNATIRYYLEMAVNAVKPRCYDLHFNITHKLDIFDRLIFRREKVDCLNP